jgi:hypothetical protein
MTSVVRLATEADEDALYDLLMALWVDNPLGLPARPEVVLANILSGTRPKIGKPLAIIGVIDDVSRETPALVGSVGLFLGQAAWFVDDIWWMFERWMYVRPTAPDRAAHAAALFDWTREQRDKMREGLGPDYPWAFEVVMSWTGSDRQAAKDRLWAKHGTKVGSSFILT